MDVQELKNVIRGRFAELSDQEKTIVSDAADSPVGDVMRKLFRELLESTDRDFNGMDASDMPERAPARPFEGGALLTEEEFKDRIKRDNKPVGDQMKTLLGTR